MSLSQATLVFVVLAPGFVFGILASLWLLGWAPSERMLSRVTGLTFSSCALGVAALVWKVASAPNSASVVAVTFGNWFAVGDYHFPLVLMADRLSLPFLALAAVLSGLIGQFSATYLHREPGFLRFFLLLHLFAFGSLLAFAAGSFDLLAAGWEIVGITSVLLIGFFQLRPAPVENGLRVFGVYRACDIGLLVGIFLMHHWAGTASFHDGFPMLTGTRAVIVCLLLLLAACRESRAGPILGMASARHGGSDSVERHLLRRDLHPCRRIPSAPGATSARAIRARFRFGDLDWRGYSHPRHDRRPCQRRCKNFARLCHFNASRPGVYRDRARMEMDRGSTYPGKRHGTHHAVPARAVHASRLSPDALRHWRRAFADW